MHRIQTHLRVGLFLPGRDTAPYGSLFRFRFSLETLRRLEGFEYTQLPLFRGLLAGCLNLLLGVLFANGGRQGLAEPCGGTLEVRKAESRGASQTP